MSQTCTVEVIQFLRPNGRQVQWKTELDINTKSLYDDMVQHSCRFEAELLSTGQAHTTISDGENDLDVIVVPNGPEIRRGMEQMLRNKRWRVAKTNVE
jgi:4-diphosphocytidyl-2C-methyl-D-erythritol kinase